MSQQLRHNRLWRRDMQVIESHLNQFALLNPMLWIIMWKILIPPFSITYTGTIPMELFNVKKVGFSNIYCIIREIKDKFGERLIILLCLGLIGFICCAGGWDRIWRLVKHHLGDRQWGGAVLRSFKREETKMCNSHIIGTTWCLNGDK